MSSSDDDNLSTGAIFGSPLFRRRRPIPSLVAAQRLEDILGEYDDNIGNDNANASDGTAQSNERSEDNNNNNQEASSRTSNDIINYGSDSSIDSMAANIGTQRYDDNGDQGNNNNMDAFSVGDVEMKDASSDEEEGGGNDVGVQQQQLPQQQQRRRVRRRHSEDRADIADDRNEWRFGNNNDIHSPQVQPRGGTLASPPTRPTYTGGDLSTPCSQCREAVGRRQEVAVGRMQQIGGNEDEEDEAADNIGKEAVNASIDNVMDVEIEVEVGEGEGETEGGLLSPIRPQVINSSGDEKMEEGMEEEMVVGVDSLRLENFNFGDPHQRDAEGETGTTPPNFENDGNEDSEAASAGSGDVNMVSCSNFLLILCIFCLILTCCFNLLMKCPLLLG